MSPARRFLTAVEASDYLLLAPPEGSMYAFIGVDMAKLPQFDDHAFALNLLESQHVLVAPGTSFNVDYHNYFRITFLPDAETMQDVFGRIEVVLKDYS